MRRSMMLACVLAIVVAAPAFAQQTNTADMRQQVEKILTAWMDAVNNGNGQAAEAQFTANGIIIDAYGKHSGAKIPELVERIHKLGITLKLTLEDVQSLSAGQGVIATGPYTATYTNNPSTPQVQGNWMLVLEREGDAFKIRAETATRLAAPAPGK